MSGKQDLTRQEEFKRATAGVLRAMALSAVLANTAFLVLNPATVDAYLPSTLPPHQPGVY